jgi:hypothetical protein
MVIRTPGRHRPSGHRKGRIYSMMAVCFVVVGLLICASSALAKPSPGVSWTPARGVTEGSVIPFSWSSRHLGKTDRLVVQRPVGTAHVWKTMLKLSKRKGSSDLPGQALGQYRYRLAALRGHRVLAEQVATIAVFGQVPLSVLFRHSNSLPGATSPGASLDSGVYATSATSFPYVGNAAIGEDPPTTTIFSVQHNHCVAVHIDFVLGETPGEGYSYPASVYGIVSLVQQSRDPVASEVPLNGLGSVSAELIPGQTWSLLTTNADRNGIPAGPTVYFNGYATCDSTESLS